MILSIKTCKPVLFFAIFLLIGSIINSEAIAQDAGHHPFENEIKAFEKEDAAHSPPQHAILFVGSSSIRKWTTLQQDFPDKQVINRGFGGSQFSGLLYYANRIVFPYHPRQIFVYEGDNDLAAGVTPTKIYDRFKIFVQRVNKKLPKTEVNFLSIKPSPSRRHLIGKMQKANGMIQEYALRTDHVRYVDVFNAMLDWRGEVRGNIFSSDSLHMNHKGYDIWQRIVRPYVY